MQQHHVDAAKGIVFWNPNYDQQMVEIAIECISDYLSRHPEDQYPYLQKDRDDFEERNFYRMLETYSDKEG